MKNKTPAKAGAIALLSALLITQLNTPVIYAAGSQTTSTSAAQEEDAQKATEPTEVDITLAKAVSDAITALPEGDALTYADEKAITDVRSFYNALTDIQKPLVTNLERLEAAERTIATMRAADQATADSVQKDIDSLPEKEAVTIDMESEITRIRASYESLTEDQQALITGVERLEAAEERIARLKKDLTKDQMYEFTAKEDTPALSVHLRFTTDIDGDGIGDQPEIVLIEPDKTTIIISQPATGYKDEQMECDVIWNTNFLQIDFANIIPGEWKIHTSFPVLFSTTDYAGIEKAGSTEKTEEKKTEEKTPAVQPQPTIPLSTYLLIGVPITAFLVMLIVLGIHKKKAKRAVAVEKKEELTAEDEIKRLKEELAAQEREYEDHTIEEAEETQEDVPYVPEGIKNDETIMEITDDDDAF